MSNIAPLAFGLILLFGGLIATVSPSGVRLFYEKLGARSPFNVRTIERSIRFSGVIALLMAAVVLWASIYAQ
jgi:uncharacterized protein YjeT (DUF2065 family)